MTALERLEKINIAIDDVESGGQEIRYNGQLVRRGDLGVLYAERRRLQDEARVEQKGNNDGWSVAVFHR